MGNCLNHAHITYSRRGHQDTHPAIIQILSETGEHLFHWCYLSDQVVSTDDFWSELGAYEGPVEQLPPHIRAYFEEGRYEIDSMETQLAERWWLKK